MRASVLVTFGAGASGAAGASGGLYAGGGGALVVISNLFGSY